MIVNLYVDHLMSTPPASAEQVWAETHEHAKLFADAAQRIGLTPAEYQEFRRDLLAGRVSYVTLPRRLTAMSGDRRGSVYAVHNAYLTQKVEGWRVALDDGNVVYVPQMCGNISLLEHGALAHVARKPPRHIAYAPYWHPHFVPAVGSAKEVPVAVLPPASATAPVAVAPVAPAATSARGISPFFFIIPAVIGGIIGATQSSPTPAPCTHGSNAMGACSK